MYHCHESSFFLLEEAQKSRKSLFYPSTACLVEINRELLLLLCCRAVRMLLTVPSSNKKFMREYENTIYLKHRGLETNF